MCAIVHPPAIAPAPCNNSRRASSLATLSERILHLRAKWKKWNLDLGRCFASEYNKFEIEWIISVGAVLRTTVWRFPEPAANGYTEPFF
jgi:hypothetical protein